MSEKTFSFEIEKIGEEKYIKIVEWVTHRRGKNYIAEIKGRHKKFKFDRKFLNVEKIDENRFYSVNQFRKGRVYDFNFVYYTCSGSESPHLKEYGVCKKISDDKIFFETLNEKEILNHLAKSKNKKNKKYKNNFKIQSKKDLENVKEYLNEQYKDDVEELNVEINISYLSNKEENQ